MFTLTYKKGVVTFYTQPWVAPGIIQEDEWERNLPSRCQGGPRNQSPQEGRDREFPVSQKTKQIFFHIQI